METNKEKDIHEIEEKPLNRPEDETKTKTWKEKVADAKNNITVEPLLAGLIIPSIISRFAMTNLNLDKACRVNLNFTDEICNSLVARDKKNYTLFENEVQKLISSIDIWKSVLNTLIPCIIIMFLGAWSDRTGKRKLIILLPICGELVTSISNLLNVYFFYEIPVEYTVLLETIFPAFTGGWVTMFLGVFAYISDITTPEMRTFRVGMVNFCMTVGVPIGISLSGIMLKVFGYYTIFSMTGLLFFMVLSYGCICLRETEEIMIEKGIALPDRTNNKNVSFFNISHVVDTLRVAFRRRVNNKRSKVILTLFTVFIVYGPTMSEHSIFYLYVRSQLNWDMVKYSLLVSYSIILHAFGALFSITVLSRKYQVDDSILCLISCLSKFVGSIWIAFARTDLEMYLLPLVEILNATTFTSLRSIISKIVDKEENAKCNSLFSLTETLASLLFHPFYSWTYRETLEVLPGTVFLISATLMLPACVILLIFYVQHKKEQRIARKDALQEEKKSDNLKKNIILDANKNKIKSDSNESIDNVNSVKTKL